MGQRNIAIRPASTGDREAIREVARETWHDTYGELDPATIDETVADWYDDESFSEALEKPGTAVIVAESAVRRPAAENRDTANGEARPVSRETVSEANSLEEAGGETASRDGEVVGFAHGVVSEDEGDVLRMYVHPDHQREGIGTALHERLRTSLEDFHMNRMRAIDLASNEGGRRFYEQLGFEESGEGEVEMGGETRKEVVYTLEL